MSFVFAYPRKRLEFVEQSITPPESSLGITSMIPSTTSATQLTDAAERNADLGGEWKTKEAREWVSKQKSYQYSLKHKQV